MDKNRRVRNPQHKAQREGDGLAQIGDNSIQINADGQLKFKGGEPPKFEEKFKKTFLENQTGFHQPPKQEVIASTQSTQRSAMAREMGSPRHVHNKRPEPACVQNLGVRVAHAGSEG